MNNILNALIAQTDWAILVLRVIVGIIFLVHGWPKIKNFKGTANWLASQGYKPGWLWCTVVATAEFGGGLLILAGAYIQIAALILVVNMIVATITNIRNKKPFKNGWELDVLLIGALLALTTLGGGYFTLL